MPCGWLLLLLLLSWAVPAAAQLALPGTGRDQPITITADDSMEWLETERAFIARGNAVASQGENTVMADQLAAFETITDGKARITRLVAEGNVRINRPDQSATATRAVYDETTGLLLLTGDNLRLTDGTTTVTARDAVEYWEKQRLAVARGAAEAKRDGQSLQANRLVVHFTPGADDALQATLVEAEGTVRIRTATDQADGDRARYDLVTDRAELTGNVRLQRDQSILTGNRAEVDFATNRSRLLSTPGTPVRALLTPAAAKSAAPPPEVP